MDKNLIEGIVVEVVQKIMAHVNKMGDLTITHSTMCNWIGSGKIDDYYYSLVQKIKKVLKKNFGIFLVCDIKNGYKAVKKGEEIDVCVGTIERGKRLVHRGYRDTHYIDVTSIADESKRNRTIEKTQAIFNLDLMLRNGDVIKKETPTTKIKGKAMTENLLASIPGYRK